MLSAIWTRRLQYAFIAIVTLSVGFSLYQWNASRASTNKTAPNNGLVGYWSFDEGTGTLAGDSSVNKNTGTLTNGPTWVDGRLGKAVSLDGVNDYIDMGNASALKPTFPFSVSTWAMIPSGGSAVMITTADTVSPVGEYSGYSVAIATNQIVAMVGNNAGWCSGSYRNTYVTNSTTLNVNQWYHVTAVFTNASSFSVYVNGSSVALTQSGTNGISIGYAAGVPLRIGRRFNSCPDTTYYDKGIVDELRIYNRALSGTEITNLYNLGAAKLNTTPTANLTSGLVGYWTFDGKDTPWSSSSAGTATDRSGNSNTGTLTNMSQSTSIIPGKLGQALDFDGTDDYATIPDHASLDVTDSTNFSLSGWFNRDTFTTDDTIIAKSNGQTASDTGYNAYIDDSTDKLTIVANDGTDQYKIESVSTFTATGWHHFTLVWDDTSSANTKLYIDGVSESVTTTGTFANVNSLANALTFRIGAESDNGNPFDGKIDEVRMYNRALSVSEVQSLYDLGASDKVNSSVSQNQGTGRLDSGLVGYWKLDDNTGTTATDSGVRSINGTLTNGPTWGTGRIGSDVVFDGTNDYIATTGNTPFITLQLQPHSFFAWVYPLATSATQSIISYGQSDDNDWSSALGLRGATRTATWLGNGTNENSIAISSLNVPVDQWSFVGVVLNGTSQVTFYVNGQSNTVTCTACGNVVTSDPFTIGATYYAANRGGYLLGSVDEARAYNRALSADEVNQLYRLTAPTGVDTSLKGYWSFNGKDTNWTSSSAGTTTDLSGSGNTGTLTNMSQSTSIIPGKIGQALNFDGADDYIAVTNNASLQFSGAVPITLSAWVKPSQVTTFGTFLIKGRDSLASSTNYALRQDSTGKKLEFYFYNTGVGNYNIWTTSSNVFPASNIWYHVVITYTFGTGGSMVAYVNGVSVAGTWTLRSGNDTADVDTQRLTIGRWLYTGTQEPFTGQIDEVRIYNRALSATEVAALYNSGR